MEPPPPNITKHIPFFLEAVFSMARKIYGRQTGDPTEALNVNLAVWRIFMNGTLRAAVHLGKDYDTNLRHVKNHIWNSLETNLFFRLQTIEFEETT